MSSVRRTDTLAEVVLRRALWRRRLRYRLHDKQLPGTPDIVFPAAHVVVFVDGDYWHGRAFAERGLAGLRASFRTARRDWWVAKILRNIERDRRVDEQLQDLGWKVIRVWERDVLKHSDSIATKIKRVLRRRTVLTE